MTEEIISNRDFAKTNMAFRNACKKAFVEPSVRQASKFRNNRGFAFKAKKHPETKWIKKLIEMNSLANS